MGAQDLQQSMLDAIQLLSNKAANSTNAAITIKGEIVEQIDAGKRQYSISYGGTVYKDAYSIADATYSISTVVYVLIPDGNFDNPKIILSTVAPAATNYVDDSETQDIYIPISGNLFGTIGQIDLRSWKNETKTVGITNSFFSSIFDDYLNSYNTFLFSARIKTEIDKDHQCKGNYGLILYLPFKQRGEQNTLTSIYKSYVMDVSTMQGNPYQYDEYAKIDLYFPVEDNLIYDTERSPTIQAFVRDFGYVTEPTRNPDIHIKDISFSMVDVLSKEDVPGYYLSVIPSEGNYFLGSTYNTVKTLTPVLRVNGKVTDVSDWDCYWFEENTSISNTSEDYFALGGLGWKCLNDKTNVTYNADGRKTFQYITNNYSYTVKKDDIISTLKFQCVLTKDEVVVSGTVYIKNLDSKIVMQLVSATGSNAFVKDIGEVRLIARLYYNGVTNVNRSDITYSTSWQRFDKDGNFIANEINQSTNKEEPFYTIVRWNDKVDYNIVGDGATEKCIETEIKYPCTKLDQRNTVKCTFFLTENVNGTVVQKNLGTREIMVTTDESLSYTLTIYGGDVLYKYDADGDSPMVADYDGPATSKVTTIEPLAFKVFKPDGTELTENEYLYVHYYWYFPVNSMMKLDDSIPFELDETGEYKIIESWGSSNNINYSILEVYNKTKTNNSILLTVDFNGIVISDSKSPKFIKDGESGTNGTKYAAVIEYHDRTINEWFAYGERYGIDKKVRKCQAIYIDNLNTWKIYNINNNTLIDFNEANTEFKIVVYKDGVVVDDETDSSFGYSATWEMFDYQDTAIINDPTQSSDYLADKIDCCFSINGNGETANLNRNPKRWDNVNNNYCCVIKCTVTIREKSITDSGVSLCAYYPIEMTWVQNNSIIISGNKVKFIPRIDGGYSEVLYASDGTNPQYDNSNHFICVDNLYETNNEYYQYEWSTSRNLKKLASGKDDSPASVNIKPIAKFDNGITKNYVKVQLTLKQTERDKINTIITNLTNQKNDYDKSIKYYQYIKTYWIAYINDLYRLINNNNKNEDLIYVLKNKLDKSSTILNYRFQMFNYIDELRKQLIDFNNYLTEKNIIKGRRFEYVTYNNLLNNAYNALYLLGTSSTYDLSKLISLNNAQLIMNDTDSSNFNSKTIKDTYGIIVAKTIDTFVQIWNVLVISYRKVYSEITRINDSGQYIYQAEYQNLEEFDSNLYNSNQYGGIRCIPNNSNLQRLTEAHEGKDYEANDFIQLKNQLTLLTNKLTTISSEGNPPVKNGELTSFITYQQMLEDIFSRLDIYFNEDYLSNRYQDLIEEYTKLKVNKEQEIAEYNNLLIPVNTTFITHIKPVIILTNRYEMSHINGWDGNKLYIDERNQQYILAPQVGAGKKDTNNTFTGIIMGVKQFTKDSRTDASDRQKIGLFGFNKGAESIFLNAQDGSAIFGLSGSGQITIDPSQHKGLLYSSNYWNNYKADGKPDGYGNTNKAYRGMLINLTDSEIHLGDSTGKIYSGAHTSLDNKQSGIYFSHDGLSIGEYFTVYALTEGDKTKGQAIINQTGSALGEWEISNETIDGKTNKRLKSVDGGIYLDAPNSQIRLGSVTKGKIFSGIKSTWDSKEDGFYLSHDGLAIGDSFRIYTDSKAEIDKDGSNIGQWRVKTKYETDEHGNIKYDDEGNPIVKYRGLTSNNDTDGIFLDARTSSIVLGSGYSGKIYSGQNYTLGATNSGFHLSDKGLSIGTRFIVNATEGLQPGSDIGGWTVKTTKNEAKEIIDQGLYCNDPPEIYSTTGKGIYMDSLNSQIILGAEGGRIYSGKHTSLNSTETGFHLSDAGLSIGENFIVYAKQVKDNSGKVIGEKGQATITEPGSNIGNWKVEESKETIDGVEVTHKGIVSNKDSGIFMDSENSWLILGNSAGRIYSGKHYYLYSTNDGFYLSHDGLSISKNFTVYAKEVKNESGQVVGTPGQAVITEEESNIGYWKVKTTYETNPDGSIKYDDAGNPIIKYRGIVSSGNSGIYLDSVNSTIVLGSQYGKIYSGQHYKLQYDYTDDQGVHHVTPPKGFYLSNDGLGIHNIFRVSADEHGNGILEVGLINRNTDINPIDDENTRKWWVISGSGTYGSYISYNANAFNASMTDGTDDELPHLYIHDSAKTKSVYLGTNGIRLGKGFAVDNQGNAYFKGHIEASSGHVGKWTLDRQGNLYGKEQEVTTTETFSESGLSLTVYRGRIMYTGFCEYQFYRQLYIDYKGNIEYKFKIRNEYYNDTSILQKKPESEWGSLIDIPLDWNQATKDAINKFFGNWHLNNDGSVHIGEGTEPSNFGGLLIGIKNQDEYGNYHYNTRLESEYPAHANGNGVFGGTAFTEIQKIADDRFKANIANYKAQNGDDYYNIVYHESSGE